MSTSRAIERDLCDRIPTSSRDLPQGISVYWRWLLMKWARGTTGRRVHGVENRAATVTGSTGKLARYFFFLFFLLTYISCLC
jgi:hypothetical protein